jgi:hypothetical protein
MQDRYAGDIGDFGKFGLLRQMAKTNLVIGVNWYRTYRDEEHIINQDGKHIAYLADPEYAACDQELWLALGHIVKTNRSVEALEQENLILNACYYKELLQSSKARSFSRADWHRKAQMALIDAELVFCDPDNGLLVPSISLASSKSEKYITEQELQDYFAFGKSVIFYNHRSRQKEDVYIKRFQELAKSMHFPGSIWLGMKFVRGTVRDYFFILHPMHVKAVKDAVSYMLQSEWARHFTLISQL